MRATVVIGATLMRRKVTAIPIACPSPSILITAGPVIDDTGPTLRKVSTCQRRWIPVHHGVTTANALLPLQVSTAVPGEVANQIAFQAIVARVLPSSS